MVPFLALELGLWRLRVDHSKLLLAALAPGIFSRIFSQRGRGALDPSEPDYPPVAYFAAEPGPEKAGMETDGPRSG